MASNSDDVDISTADRGVWLVKVPKYLANEWEKAGQGAEIGKIRIGKDKSDIYFDASDSFINKAKAAKSKSPRTASTPDELEIPKSHKFIISDVTHQNMSVFSVDKAGKSVIEGFVQQKGECRPTGDDRYMKLKMKGFVDAAKPKREVKMLDRAVGNSYKPVAQFKSDLLLEKQKKEQGKKAREDKEVVISKLLTAFEKHQYYAMRDLEKITNQPVPYLKEILKEIGIYNNKNKHKNLWELKPEYRHYNRDPNEPSTSS